MKKVLFDPFDEYNINEKSRLIIRDKVNNIYTLKKVIEKKGKYNLDISKYSPYWNFRYKYQVRGLDNKTGEERWVDQSKYKVLYPEQINENGMKYLLFEEPKSDKLLVIFQAINKNPSYNYVGTLSEFPVNKLFIKDDYGKDKATKSSYYVGNNKNTYISEMTQKLIIKVANDLSIDKSNTIFIGSSKGGFGALYHGFLFGAGYIIAGGPTVLLGQQLSRFKERNSIPTSIFKNIIGEITNENIDWADNLMKNAIHNSKQPHPIIKIHVGLWDTFYKNHVIPFMEIANQSGINDIELNIRPYRNHAELASHFPQFLIYNLNNIINKAK
ncbi:hypothetical protein [Jeotgalicoccus sp. FSL K6-3177]|uniref:hypothetical protein n=1 Tax=Jeotgalicoccus sp. FSL K6-3177 TaxID=2921494 RepID=UPI0030FD5201